MNPNPGPTSDNGASRAALGFLMASLIFVALAAAIKFSGAVPAIDADSAAARAKALAEIRAAEDSSLNTAGWIDRSRGVVRLPIETAMQITARDWQSPATARSNLIKRAENAAAPAPAAPAKPNLFE